MSVTCPNCGFEFEPGGGAESDDMDADDMATSDAVPYEAMQAAPGAMLAADAGGEVVQSYASPEMLKARGMRPFAPGSAPEAADMASALRTPQPLVAVDENGVETQTYATPEQIRARGWTIKGAPDGAALSQALRSR